MKAGSLSSSAGLWNTVRNKNKALIFTKLISNLGFGSPVMNRDSGYICNAVPADWHWETIPHRRGRSAWGAALGAHVEAEVPILSQWCSLTKNYEKSYHEEREENEMQTSEGSGRQSI